MTREYWGYYRNRGYRGGGGQLAELEGACVHLDLLLFYAVPLQDESIYDNLSAVAPNFTAEHPFHFLRSYSQNPCNIQNPVKTFYSM